MLWNPRDKVTDYAMAFSECSLEWMVRYDRSVFQQMIMDSAGVKFKQTNNTDIAFLSV